MHAVAVVAVLVVVVQAVAVAPGDLAAAAARVAVGVGAAVMAAAQGDRAVHVAPAAHLDAKNTLQRKKCILPTSYIDSLLLNM